MLFSLGLLSATFFVYKTRKMKVFGFEDHFAVNFAFIYWKRIYCNNGNKGDMQNFEEKTMN